MGSLIFKVFRFSCLFFFKLNVKQAFSGCFLSYILCYSQQSAFYGDLFFAPEHEAAESMILFDISEDGFYVTTSLLSPFYALFAVQKPMCSFFVCLKLDIDLYNPVIFRFMTCPVERAR